MRGAHGLVRRLTLFAASLAVGLLVCEIALRLFKPQPIGFDMAAIWEPAEGIGRRPRPNIDVYVNTGERDARLINDAAGHRIGASPKPAAQLRILAVGDSMLEAIQVDYEQTMTALLERSLSNSTGRSVDVVNAGMGGWDPNQYLIAVRTELERSSYDLILVFVYLDNDIVGRRVASVPPDRGLVAPVLRPFGDPPALTLANVKSRTQAWLRQHSHLFVLYENLTALMPIRFGTRPHMLSTALRVNSDAPMWGITADILADVSVAAERANTRVLYVLLPPAHYIDPQFLATLEWSMAIPREGVDIRQPAAKISSELSRRGLDVFDSTPALQQAFDAGERNLYGHIDVHLAPAGHRVMAEFLARIVEGKLAAAGATP